MQTKLLSAFLLLVSTVLWAQNEPIAPKLKWSGAEGTYVWNEDGSIEVRDGELIMTSGVVESQADISHEEMVIVSHNPYVGDGEGRFGPYMRKLQSGAYGEFRIVGRSRHHGNDRERHYGVDFTSNDHLLFGKRGNPSHTDQFLRQKENWNAYSYYAYGASTSQSHIKSDDFTHLFRRPKSADWWDTFEDIVLIVIVVAVLVAAGAVAASLFPAGGYVLVASVEGGTVGLAYASTMWAGLGIAGLAGVTELAIIGKRVHHGEGVVQHGPIYQKEEVSTGMEMLIPQKIDNPQTEAEKNLNAEIDDYLNIGFTCSDSRLTNRKCYNPSLMAVGAMAKVNRAHLQYVTYPGSFSSKMTPYELFFNPLYRPPLKGKILVAAEGSFTKGPTSATFTDLEQPLPKTVIHTTEAQTLFIDFQDYEDEKTYLYLVGKADEAPAGLEENYYHDLGAYGTFNGVPYNLYRINPVNFDGQGWPLTVDETGPFIAGDNLEMYDSDIRILKNDNLHFSGELNAKLGDRLTIEIDKEEAPDSEGLHVLGFPGVWKANFSWDVMYYRTESQQPGDYHPFLAFDSQVHSLFLRRHQDYFQPDGNGGYQLTVPDWEDKGDYWSWEYTVQARMDGEKLFNSYEPLMDWEVAKYNGTDYRYQDADGNWKTGTYDNTQRHDQRRGDMMLLLNSWKNHSAFDANGIASGFQPEDLPSGYVFSGDPDDIFYFQRKNRKVIDGDGKPKVVNVVGNTWHKLLPQEQESNTTPYKDNLAISYMVTAYQRSISANPNVPPYVGYEIEDKGNYKKNDGSDCTGGADCYYLPVTQEDNHHAAPGELIVKYNNNELYNAGINATSPQSVDYGFYGSIIGTEWPAQYEQNVPYTFLGLAGLPGEELDKYSMVLEHEGHTGILERTEKKLKDRTDKNGIRASGSWTENFDMPGWGSNSLTVYYKDCDTCDSVIVAGKELNEIQLRFMTLEQLNKDGGNVVTIEKKAPGYHWYMQDSREGEYQQPKYGGIPNEYGREFVISENEEIIVSFMDADPHTFRPAGLEFYKSNRSKSKRIPNDSLSSAAFNGKSGYLQWEIHQLTEIEDGSGYFKSSGNLTSKSGRKIEYQFSTAGIYSVKGIYRNTSSVSMLVRVIESDYTFSDPNVTPVESKGDIVISEMTDEQWGWLVSNNAGLASPDKNLYRIAMVKPLSKYAYQEPTMRNVKSYDHQNDFHSQFQWYNGSDNSNARIHTSNITYQINPDPLFPEDWVRHTVLAGTSGKSIDANQVVELTEANNWDEAANEPAIITHLDGLFASPDLPEKWNLRLPWIATMKTHGKQVRNNVKSVISRANLFDPSIGAFSGKGNVNYATLSEYEDATRYPMPVSEGGLTGEAKAKQEFYFDLLQGRKILIAETQKDNLSVYSTNTAADGSQISHFIATNVTSGARLIQNDSGSESKGLVLYPNANNGTFHLNFGLEESSEVQVEVASLEGRIVFDQQLFLYSGRHQVTISLPANVAKGLYVLRMKSAEISESRTIRVE